MLEDARAELNRERVCGQDAAGVYGYTDTLWENIQGTSVRPSKEEYLHVAVKVPMECPTPEAADAIAGLAQWAGRACQIMLATSCVAK